ncbi:hypothetical protein CACET_c21280 [Clostridium aceticum]|uniref:Uncharacterized protein n=1 Tax=Clostridium aceticum TaxID=84022 RepID=A0A0D8I9B9_9CLOT|nr:hypothetical protein [Clostridium aceticum]AKL95575.1 hypothetical protein CACET_c21280 [Clostridium aceticum]KJF26848.1 hypothetical protein TZ02_11630 [Clostridium aceticum]
MEECALCKKKAELKNSHIIPKFVTDWIKKTGPTGFLRDTNNAFRLRVQDGLKVHLLCGECEQLFSKHEKIFAEKIFIPYLKDKMNYHFLIMHNFIQFHF